MGKQVLFNEEAKASLKEGVNIVADAVGSSMGASGKTVIIARPGALPPDVTKDGVSIAMSVVLDDNIQNVGAQLIRQASYKTLKDAGDGTTQTVVLAQSLINQGLDAVAKGANPQQLKREIEEAVACVLDSVKSQAIKVDSKSGRIKEVATISANGDESIGLLIAQAYEKIGDEGLLTIEDSGTIETSIEVIDGVEIPRGYISQYFVNNNEKMQAVHEEPLFLVTDYHLKSFKADLLPILQKLDEAKLIHRPLIIIAQDYEGEAYSSMLMNHKQGNIKCCLCKAPATYRKEHLQDIATITGATIIRDEDGLKMDSVTPAHLGSSKKVVISEQSTLIIGGEGDKKALEDLKMAIKVQISDMKNDEMKMLWEGRLARISGSIGVIKVGGATDVEVKEKRDRVDDACRAVKSAIEEGVVAGGGVALIRSSESMPLETKGAALVYNACFSPIKKMLSNAGFSVKNKSLINRIFGNEMSEIDGIIEEIVCRPKEFGYDLRNHRYVKMVDSGIIDPAKVIRCALQNAASVAGAVITSDCLIVDVPEKK